jgi:hypothetical protein
MKKLVCYLMLLVCYSAYSQETDTIMYSDIECNEPISTSETQSVSIQLKNDTLTLSGKIIANCCGTHFLKYEVFEDIVNFTRIDTGNLCDCYCLHDIVINIGGCTSGFYNVKLHEYSGNDGIDTLIQANQTGINNINNEKKTKIYPNPFNESTTISFSNPNLDCFTFKMFDCSGSLIKTINSLNSNSFQLQRGNLNIGFYYFYLCNSDKIYYSGKLLIK